MTELTGFILIASIIGNIAFGFKSLSQVIKCIRSRSVYGISPLMLILDFIGNIGCGYSIYMTTGFTLWPQFVNYFCATLFLIILFVLLATFGKKKEVLCKESELTEMKRKADMHDRLLKMDPSYTKKAAAVILSDAKIQCATHNTKYTVIDGHVRPIPKDDHIQHNED